MGGGGGGGGGLQCHPTKQPNHQFTEILEILSVHNSISLRYNLISPPHFFPSTSHIGILK